MQKYYFPADIRRADVIASEKCGVPSVVLMENASKNAAAEAAAIAQGDGPFVILAGVGNNGGDAFAAARHLLIQGRDVIVLKCAADDGYKGDAAVNLSVLRRIGCARLKLLDTADMADTEITKALNCASCIIDGLLGTGTSGAPRNEPARIISLLSGRGNILSLDIPSGTDPENGSVYEPCVKASATVTFLAPKFGMALEPARSACGRVITADIGVPPYAVLPGEPAVTLLSREDMRSLLPVISRDIHKTKRGNVLIIAGSSEYRGAPLLTALGALRAGAGLVFLAVPEFMAQYAIEKLPETIVLPLPEKDGRMCVPEAKEMLFKVMEKCSAVAAGPGCGRSVSVERLFSWLWQSCKLPMLLDADMLWFFASHKETLAPRSDVLLTPHSAEAGRILGITASEVDLNRAASVRVLSEKAGSALLKGRNTLIYSDDGLKMIDAGSPALAVPGSGDVLTGVIGAFMASGMKAADAAAAGALAHALAGEALEEKYGTRGTLASEIADAIPAMLG
ncbi:MAG: NAD(P)H-hydrate dehydratase [Synergistes sp.]|nr:NAD(P)H-hydrate dehydratase [Synergistes sp.]